ILVSRIGGHEGTPLAEGVGMFSSCLYGALAPTGLATALPVWCCGSISASGSRPYTLVQCLACIPEPLSSPYRGRPTHTPLAGLVLCTAPGEVQDLREGAWHVKTLTAMSTDIVCGGPGICRVRAHQCHTQRPGAESLQEWLAAAVCCTGGQPEPPIAIPLYGAPQPPGS